MSGLCGVVGVILYGVTIERAPTGWAYYLTAAGALWILIQCILGTCMNTPVEVNNQATNGQTLSYPNTQLSSVVIQPPPPDEKAMYNAPPAYTFPQ